MKYKKNICDIYLYFNTSFGTAGPFPQPGAIPIRPHEADSF